jgi:hypothetical protein
VKRLFNSTAIGTSLTVLAVQANAAVPTEVSTALTDLSTDMTTVGTGLVLAAAAILGLKWIKASFFG